MPSGGSSSTLYSTLSTNGKQDHDFIVESATPSDSNAIYGSKSTMMGSGLPDQDWRRPKWNKSSLTTPAIPVQLLLPFPLSLSTPSDVDDFGFFLNLVDFHVT